MIDENNYSLESASFLHKLYLSHYLPYNIANLGSIESILYCYDDFLLFLAYLLEYSLQNLKGRILSSN